MSASIVNRILEEAKQSGISFFLEEDKLKLRVPKHDKVAPALWQLIDEWKESIKSFLLLHRDTMQRGHQQIEPVKRNGSDHLPLSFAQERLWFIDRMQGSVPYHLSWVFRLQGALDVAILEAAFKEIVQRHEVLRTVIGEEDGVGYQAIKAGTDWRLHLLTEEALTAGGQTIPAYISAVVSQPYDLSVDQMLKVSLIRVQPDEHILLVLVHHIAFDGWSVSVLVRELKTLYLRYAGQSSDQLLPLDIQYADYALWQRNYLSGNLVHEEQAYWRRQLKEVTPLELPTTYPRPAIQSNEGAIVQYQLPAVLHEGLLALSQEEGVTYFMTLLAAFKALLFRYTNQQDICIGTPVAGRRQQETESLIGFFVNTLALRSQVAATDTFSTLLQAVKTTTLAAYEHQDIPFEKVVELLRVERDMSRNPIFQVLFVLQNMPEAAVHELGDIRLTALAHTQVYAKFDIELSATVLQEGGVQLSLTYCRDLFDEATMTRMLQHYGQLLEAIVKNRQAPVGALPVLLPEEHSLLLGTFNDTAVAYPATQTLVGLFEAQVLRTPGQVATVFEGQTYTYQALNEHANRLAHYLRGKGVGEDVLVPLCVDRSLEMIVAILGVLKAGGAYVPIDPAYPAERIRFILEDTGAAIVLSGTAYCDMLSAIAPSLEVTDVAAIQEWPAESVTDPGVAILPDHLAYVIYTSGSTGHPKGVMVEHAGIVNRLLWAQDYFRLTAGDAVLQKTTYCFDVSVWELIWPLLAGAKLVFAGREGQRDTAYLRTLIDRHGITMIHFVPSMLEVFLDSVEAGDCSSLREVLCSGEALKPGHITLFREKLPGAALYNLYGPTEASIDVSCWQVPVDAGEVAVSIGKPISNTQLYILDANKELVSIGVAGELYIGGVSLARGYLNRETLTAERFVANPFGAGRLYRTGDMACWQADGNISYLGRTDDQVKIRGYRVELGEVENALQQAPGVKQAAVVTSEDTLGNKRLTGYVVPSGDFDQAAVVQYLQRNLPAYMVPAFLLPVDAIPLTSNGKADKKQLLAIAPTGPLQTTYAAPRNEVEIQLADIWGPILGVEKVGIYDNFFDMGGHSLLVMRVIAAIRKRLQWELGVRELFLRPTIAAISASRDANANELLPPISLRPRNVPLPLSFAQERLWFIDKLQGSLQYHMPWIFQVQGRLDIPALEAAFRDIIQRHEVLRTVITEKDGIGYQQVLSGDNWQLQSATAAEAGVIADYIAEIINRPYDLSGDSMLQVHLVQESERSYVLLILVHHIAFDGWSVSVLARELEALYGQHAYGQQAAVASLPVQYADYACWQREYLQGPLLERQLAYWKTTLQEVTPLSLSLDHARPAIQSTQGAAIHYRLNGALRASLVTLAREEGVTLFMTLLSAFKTLLYRYTGQEDICVGTPVAGRHQQETESLIGFFVNTLALRSKVNGHLHFRELLQEVKATTLAAYEHQEVPFEKVVEALGGERDMSRNPIFQVLFVLQDMPEATQEWGDVLLTPLDNKVLHTRFDLELSATLHPEDVELTLTYCRDLFDERTMANMLQHYERLLESVVADRQLPLSQLPMLLTEEQSHLLYDFNEYVAYPADQTILSLFEAQVNRVPDHIALTFEGVSLTYRELNEQAERLAHYLDEKGVREGVMVPVCAHPSLDMIKGIFGILKAGGVYVPIDPEYPADRIQYILQDTGAQLLVATAACKPMLHAVDATVEIVDIAERCATAADVYHPVTVPVSSLAYVIYTSGSTGQPKGVMISHENVISLLQPERPLFDFNDQDVWTLAHSFSFDFSVWEIFGALCFGGRLVIASRETVRDVVAFGNLIQQEGVTVLNQTPAAFYMLQEQLLQTLPPLALRYVILGGDALSPSRLKSWPQHYPACSLINMYGITETTVHVTYKKLELQDLHKQISNVGKPIPTLGCYVLDGDGMLVPAGVVGELYVGGAGVARGYLNQPGLSSRRFMPNPYRAGERWYRSGDMVRRLPNGDLEYLGRADDQVKIRGHRIELGEVTSVLSKAPGVKQAVVIADKDASGNGRLVGYVVPAAVYAADMVSAYLKEKLPAYMVPGFIISLNSIPLTSNGKVNKKQLPVIANTAIRQAAYVAPRNDLEAKLVDIWQRILGIPTIGVYDNFFELGGHSLLVTRVVAAIRKELQWELTVKYIFLHGTVAAIATHLQTAGNSSLLPAIAPRKDSGRLPLSFAQERLWFIDKLEGSLQYHMPWVFRLKGQVAVTALESAFRAILQRHEVLRTVIREENGIAYQQVNDVASWKMVITESEGQQEEITALIHQPFDLSADYMLRITLLQLPDASYVMVIVIHHIAADGWSLPLIVQELLALYNSSQRGLPADVPVLAVQYADYAIWQRQYLEGAMMDRQLQYWKTQLQGAVPLKLMTDHPRPLIQSSKGAIINYLFNKELSNALLQLSQREGVTLFMTLLSAFKILMHRYTGQEDICVGIPIAGRRQAELAGLIGFFVNTLALRSEVSGSETFRDILHKVQHITLDAYEHQDAPFEKVVETIAGKRDMHTNPLFNVMFAFQNTPELPALELEGMTLSSDYYDDNTAVFDFVFELKETAEGLALRFRYATDLFEAVTIHRFIAHYEALLKAVLQDEDRPVGALPLLSATEHAALLRDYAGPVSDYPADKCIIELFETQVAATPDRIALSFEGKQLTYRELNERANRFGHFLQSKGIGVEVMVPLCIDRSLDMLIGIVGILKAGGVYVPVDPDYPEDRIRHMLQDTQAPLALSSRAHKDLVGAAAGDVEVIVVDTLDLSSYPATNPAIINVPKHVAYVMYTSGSTGRPKGVLMTHRNLVSLVKGVSYNTFVPTDIMLSTSSPSFDVAAFECWGTLLNGAHLVLAPREKLLVNEQLKALIIDHKVNKLWLTTSWFNQVADTDITIFATIETVLTGGEKLSEEHIGRVMRKYPALTIINGYGPTENTTFSLTWRLDSNYHLKMIPIGQPLENRTAYVLDMDRQLVPIGVTGEIYVGGAGVASGYLNQPVLTAERFRPDPFSEDVDARLYKTGDLGRRLPDGNFEYLGRADQQVKIRGFRVEPGEVENIMNALPVVAANCVVTRRDMMGVNSLVCYYVPDTGTVRSTEQALCLQRVASWKDLYESEYGKTEQVTAEDEEFNIIGWNDSFTGQPIPVTQMREWLDDIVEVILAQQPGHVLEIGCGTGLIYYALCDKIREYTGTDFSSSSIHQIRNRIAKGRRDYCPTTLQICAAHEVSVPVGTVVDTILLNSISQYFPAEQYLTDVIGKSISMLPGKGRIIIGDVRDHRSLRWFKGRLQLNKMSPDASLKDFKWEMEQGAMTEEELCFTPEYFYHLSARYPEISHVDIRWKQGTAINELSLYRYTVILHIGEAPDMLQPEWASWNQPGGRPADIITALEAGESLIAIQDVPNFRLAKERLLEAGLKQKTIATVNALQAYISQNDPEIGAVGEIMAVAAAKGYQYRLLLDEDALKVNLLFSLSDIDNFVSPVYGNNSSHIPTTNIPLFAEIAALLQKDVRNLLLQRLPDYMVPADFIALQYLPLTDNGKADYRFLSERATLHVKTISNYRAPETPLEQQVAVIWRSLLGVERIGVHDDFFELGGHSLLVTRLVSAIRKELQIEIGVRDVFTSPTIASLSAHLLNRQHSLSLPAITPQSGEERLPLSFAQERLWFIDRLQGSVQYHMPWVFRLQGTPDMAALSAAFRGAITRHEVLRAVLKQENGTPYQEIIPADNWQLEYKEDVGLTDPDKFDRYVHEWMIRPFDLSADYMLRAQLIKLEEASYALIVVFHHIAFDGWSVSLMVNELVTLYNAYQTGQPAVLPELPVQYTDYAIWQHRYLKDILDEQLQYWQHRLRDITPLYLPTDYPRTAIPSTRGGTIYFYLDQALSNDLQQLSRREGVTLFMTMLSVFKVLLYRYTRQEDVCVGIAIANRTRKETESLIGFFVNALALRSQIDGSVAFGELLQQVKSTTLEGYTYQDVPFEKVIEAVAGKRDTAANPLIQVMFVLQNTPDIPALALGDLALSGELYKNVTSKFDLTFDLREKEEGIEFRVEYCADLFKQETIERLFHHYEQLLRAIVADIQTAVDRLDMLAPSEKHQVLSAFNHTVIVPRKDRTVIDSFEEQALLTPDETAVIQDDSRLSFRELHERANQLANQLRVLGIKAGEQIPICIDRSPEMIVGILGILKAGAAFVPVDPAWPAARIAYLLQDTEAHIALASSTCAPILESVAKLSVIIQLDKISFTTSDEVKGLSVVQPSAQQLAYIIYTSGSTGVPKGVMVTHGNLFNYLQYCQHHYLDSNNKEAGSYLHLSFTFDAAITALFVPMLAGKSLVLASSSGVDVFRSPAFRKYAPYDFIKLTPAHLQLLEEEVQAYPEQLLATRLVIGGEALQQAHIRFLTGRNMVREIVNEYGPTEATVGCSTYVLATNDDTVDLQQGVPIGKPLDNVVLYILDAAQGVLPVGVPGELYIGGAGVANGYLHQAQLTAERFIMDPFSDIPGAMMYSTGDLAKWLPDGNILYLGRIDDQVKIRGYRIEPGEVENVLNELGPVAVNCVVTRKDAMDINQLVSYYVPARDVIAAKERALYVQQVESWKELYQNQYSQTETAENVEAEFNLVGWNDSFTGKEIPAVQMRSWLDDITRVILSEQPSRVLEIGCGMGLIYFALSGQIDKYFGTDFSQSSINQIRNRVAKGLKTYTPVELQVCPAHEVKLPDGEKVDTVVINSVIQYFPGASYLTDVIGNSISMLDNNGRIIIGDVRDLRLLRMFKGRLHLNQVQQHLSLREFNWQLDQEMLLEEELCLTPDYFYGLTTCFPQIKHVDIQWKQGTYENELSLYRYTVILHVGETVSLAEPVWTEWMGIAGSHAAQNLLESMPQLLAIKDVPNPRLYKERKLERALAQQDILTVGALQSDLDTEDAESKEVNELLAAATAAGYQAKFLLDEDALKFNLVLSQVPVSNFILPVYGSIDSTKPVANQPLFAEITTLLQQDIKAALLQRLPEYMMPADLIAIPYLPLTNNGKVDRQFLSEMGKLAVRSGGAKEQAPGTPLEQDLAAIWQELLKLERVGVHDDFFELGGHSLLVVRVVSAIRKQLQIEVDLQDLFIYPTISSLAAHIAAQRQKDLLPTIKPKAREGMIPLSFAQERLWFIDKLQGSVQYNMPWVFRLKGKLNTRALEASFREIVRRHEILRTVIADNNGVGYQEVKPVDRWKMKQISVLELMGSGSDMQEYIASEMQHRYDLSKEMMLRVHLIKVSASEHVLMVMLHHIAFDGWSVAVLVKEFTELYQSFLTQRPARLPMMTLQYADFAMWQRSYLDGEVLDQKLSYWKQKLADVAPLDLPKDFPRLPYQSVRGSSISGRLDKQLHQQLLALSHRAGTTLFMTMLAVYKVLLFRYSGQEDICVGTPVAGRQQQELENMIGFFVNTVALRSEVVGDMLFSALLQQVKTTTLEAYAHQEAPFEKIVEVLGLERDMSRSAIFQVQFAMQNTPEHAELDMGGVLLSAEDIAAISTRFDVIMNVSEQEDGIAVSISYCTDMFKQATIERLFEHYTNLLQAVVADAAVPVGKLNILSPQEVNQLLFEFNDTAVPYPSDKTLIHLFEEQVARTPDNVALVFEDISLTYLTLNERANQLAHYLKARGVKAEVPVPICFDRSPEMIISILGVLKAGGGYVPIDPTYPADRIAYILEDTTAFIGLSSADCSHLLGDRQILTRVIAVDREWFAIDKGPKDNLDSELRPDQLMYIIYTSGSTGRPKGVLMEHHSLVNFVLHQTRVFNIDHQDRVLQFYNYCFDPSVEQIFLPLINGAACVLIPDEVRRDAQQFETFLTQKRITHLQATPGFLNNLRADIYGGLRRVVAGGEICSIALFERWRPICRFYNKYGPTETAITATEYPCAPDLSIQGMTSLPIGKPVANTRLYVMDAGGMLVPVGVKGELHIGGVQVARGYLNQPALTADKFIPDTYSGKEGDRLYRTGDTARWLPDGNIEYIGRVDDQIKIRGFRVEPGEVENILQQASFVTRCVVIGNEDKTGNKRLIAYVVPAAGYSREKAQEYLAGILPDYMVPGFFMEIESMPLTATGKVNKKALPEFDASEQINTTFATPRTPLEEHLVNIWKELLEVDRVGIQDDFFQLGGHSLLVTRVVSVIRKQLQVELSINDFFLYPTVEALAAQLESQEEKELLPPVTVQVRTAHIPLSFAQERLWFIDKLQGSLQYHMPWVFRMQGKPDVRFVEASFREIVRRHEVLRTQVLEREGVGYQTVRSAEDWQLQYLTLADLLAQGSDIRTYLTTAVQQPYDLSSDMMLRVHMISVSDTEHVLLVMLHHIAFDGWSISLLVKELQELYSAFESRRPARLPLLSLQYADYAIWQRGYLEGKVLEKKLAYWTTQLKGVSPLDMPADFPRQPRQSIKGNVVVRTLNSSLGEQLLQFSHQQGTTLFMTMLSAFKVLLYRYTGQHDICIGTPIAGRQQEELEGLIGFFVNTLPLRSQVVGDMPFADLLQRVKRTALDAFEHQEVPFEKIVEGMDLDRDMSRNAIFQVLFAMQNAPEATVLNLGHVTLAPEDNGVITAMFDIELSVRETKEGLELWANYCSELFLPYRIEGLLHHYEHLLTAIVQNSGQLIDSIPLIGETEMTDVLQRYSVPAVTKPVDSNFVSLFEMQAALNPEHIALVFEDTILTYQQLNERANQLAHFLRKNGVDRETWVPVCMPRSSDMIVAILGIMKAGGVYVPIDTATPGERIAYILNDTGAKVILTSDSIALTDAAVQGCIIALSRAWSKVMEEPTYDPDPISKPEDLAYVIYTSGSTGLPKGVMISHAAFRNYVSTFREHFTLTDQDVMIQQASIAFDTAVEEIFPILTVAGKLIVVKDNKDFPRIATLLHNESVTVLSTNPSFVRYYNDTGNLARSLRAIISGGDVLKGSDIDQLYDRVAVYNTYGPTEATVCATYYQVKALADMIPIGKPVPNTHVYILDKALHVLPVGVTGEICISGVQLANGYFNNAALTSQQFIPHPFNPEERLYKTGDLGSWLPDGNITYHGRVDDQIKVRGYRIEPGEIETVMNRLPAISAAAVVVKDDPQGNKRLVCFYVSAIGQDKEQLIDHASAYLPGYMIPSVFIAVDNIPLTVNGKTDRQLLLQTDISPYIQHAPYEAPRDEMEEQLVSIWQELLNVPRIGIHDNFFELGGNSIITIQVVSRARLLGHELEVGDIFIYQSITRISAALRERTDALMQDEPDVPGMEYVLLPGQKQYFASAGAGVSAASHTLHLSLNKVVTEGQLQDVVQQLAKEYVSLQLAFKQREDGSWVQYDSGHHPVITTLDLADVKMDEWQVAITAACDEQRRQLDVLVGSVFRLLLIKQPVQDTNDQLVLFAHPLVVDHASWQFITEVLEAGLTTRAAGAANITSHRQRSYFGALKALQRYSSGSVLQQQLPYWKKQLAGVRSLPVDNNTKVTLAGHGQYSSHVSDLELGQVSQLLQDINNVYNTTIADLLIAALTRTLCEWSQHPEVVIGMVGDSRCKTEDKEDEVRQVGHFRSSYPVQLTYAKEWGMSAWIRHVKESLRQTPDGGVGYEYLKDNTALKDVDQRQWDIVFSYEEPLHLSQSLHSAVILFEEHLPAGYQVREKIHVVGTWVDNQLRMKWTYSTLHYSLATITQLSATCQAWLQSIIAHCQEQHGLGVRVLTPSDYGLSEDITYEELDSFLKKDNPGSDNTPDDDVMIF
ncbi:non-ribosomal peptide synthetase [Chitinophaga pendula]|uniref:non-ribosomal peptide synthetase n=1 Tax=Chitinophaga TaxID=79328 RepID=UPI000BB0827F|nr:MULTISPECIES: non-ribosomal peptide synthetase [Chitinophaga]ASZ12182.1 hypothetical protein CK934_15050 [Chitinophaga sp. MD30]UCJ04788.1 non-ribosomal peptide synthetase [Chitinophaga pendula]